MPTTIEEQREEIELARKKREKSQDAPVPGPAAIEDDVTIDDLNARTERARREGQSGE